MADDDYERKPAASSSPPRSRDPERKERVRGDSPARGSPPRGSPPRDRARDESPRGSRGRDEKRDGREDPRSRSRSADRRPERPIYCGNYEYDMPETEIKNVFEEYGDVERIDMKTGPPTSHASLFQP